MTIDQAEAELNRQARDALTLHGARLVLAGKSQTEVRASLMAYGEQLTAWRDGAMAHVERIASGALIN